MFSSPRPLSPQSDNNLASTVSVVTSARSPRLRLCGANSVHSCISYTLSPSHIYLPLSGYNLCSRKTPHLSHFYQNIYTPTYSDRLPLFSDTIPLTRITFLSLDSHHSSLIFVVLLISSTHPPLFAACILFSLFGYLPLPISWRSPFDASVQASSSRRASVGQRSCTLRVPLPRSPLRTLRFGRR